MTTKEQKLKKLEIKMMEDKNLPLKESNLVFGEGSASARVVFIGEAPGAEEDKQKRPFVGRSGKILRETIEGIGWNPKDVYITNIVKRRPPDNRDPSPEEIAMHQPYLAEQLGIISPKVIVPLGRFSANYFIDGIKISKQQGTIFHKKEGGGTVIIYPMFHPAAGLRSTTVMDKFKSTFKKLPKVLEN